MRNLFTLLLLVVSFLAVGQTNNTTEEIKYWKSIADSNDTVAYRQYLNRYGETGLYYDEAITRITLLKTSGKQAQSKSTECCFFSLPHKEHFFGLMYYYVVKFDSSQSKVWLKHSDYNTIRSNLAMSKEYYEDLKNVWTTDEEYEFDPMKSTSSRDVYFRRDKLYHIYYEKLLYTRGSYDHHYKTDYFYLYDDEDEVFFNHTILNDDNHYTIKEVMQGYKYIAFSKNKFSIIMWFEEDGNLDGYIREKREYKRIPKEDLLPKAVKYDFLNE